MTFNNLTQYIAERKIVCNKHPTADLYIYNYTPTVQYEGLWDEVTMACRGLILDGNGAVVARPFKKFFNFGESAAPIAPSEPFEVFEKMDGSLGILYWLHDVPYIASRGSFTSEQALRATHILHTRYAHVYTLLDKSKTYLFEIIYPENRIVVDYGSTEDLVLLAIIDNESGADEALQDIGFQLVAKHDGVKDIQVLKSLYSDNREGFVLKFQNGVRLKVKFEEYVRLHRIVTQISTTDIWEHLKNKLPFDDILDRVPDEFYDWVKKTIADLNSEYAKVEAECKVNFVVLEDRKATALHFQSLPHRSVLFNMLDARDYSDTIWQIVKPAWSKPFCEVRPIESGSNW